MAEEEEVIMEVEAVQSVYGDDCVVLNTFPPHLHIHIKPRTADVHSQQFVEATIELRAGPEYPSDPPYFDIIGSKGLDEKRQKHLSTSLHDKGHELASCLMLVALCEEAVETLSSMNHPEGDCPLCLYPLVPEEKHNKPKPFMKLMSCFHCFHCECIIRWLKWIQKQNDANCETSSILSSPTDEDNLQASDLHEIIGDNTGNCPVCRKVFLAKDIEHVLNAVDSHGVDSDVDDKELSEKLLHCELEISRRHTFEATFELQQQRGGLIGPPKDNVLFSRISLEDLVREATTVTNNEDIVQQYGVQTLTDNSRAVHRIKPMEPRSKDKAVMVSQQNPPQAARKLGLMLVSVLIRARENMVEITPDRKRNNGRRRSEVYVILFEKWVFISRPLFSCVNGC